jgi:competence protein ComEC
MIAADQGNLFWEALYAFKERALAMVYQLWPDPEASLLAGILLGVESGIPEDVLEAFQDTGTAHVIAISGFNIAIVVGLFTLLFTRLLGRVKGAILAIVGILLYTLLVGAGPSVVRAALMGGLALFAYHIGRRQVGLLTMALVAAIMALTNPLILWSASFQLSFFATLGLVLYAQPLEQWLEGWVALRLPAETARRVSRPFAEFLLFTLAASLATLPIILYHFQRISLVSLVANPAILPAQPPVMVMGGLAVLLGMAFEPLGQMAAWLAWPFVAYTIRAVQYFAAWPVNALAVGQISGLAVVLMYAMLFGVTFAWSRIKQTARLVKPGLALTVLILLTVVVWRTALAAPDGRLHLTLLDANTERESGEALLIQTPTGRRLLINGGPSFSRLSDALGRRLPPFDRKLDYLVVANPEDNQVGALARGIELFTPGKVLWAGPPDASPESDYLRAALAEAEVPVTQAETGQTLELGEGARLKVLVAGERGAVFLLEWGNFRALLPIGVTFEDLDALDYGRQIGEVTALLLADGGYAPSNPPEWIAAMRPQVVLLSVAGGDREGRPDAEVLEALESYTLLRTDQNGWIELSTDWEQMWVEVERK